MTVVAHHSNNNAAAIELTSAARLRILNYLKEKNQLGLRLSLEKTGCSGLSYVLDYVSTKPEEDIEVQLEDGKFIYIEKKSFPFLKGLKIDYVRQGISCKFTFENPNQTGQCGCGESFTVNNN